MSNHIIPDHPMEDHDLGLRNDLQVIEKMAVERRKALRLFAGAGSALFLTSCGGSGSSGSSTGTTVTVTPTPSTTVTPTPTPTPTTTTSCSVPATETAGPYPGDGTNTSSGVTSNVLPLNGVVRSDMRSSFVGSSTATAAGVQVTLTITVVNVNSSCAPLVGYAIYLWHCTRDGQYSLYDLPNESYLRGVQVTDSNGQVTFTTIFPGCYAGRFPHMHFEVFSSLANATSGRFAVLTSQFAIPSAACTTVYDTASGYTASRSNFASVSIASDGVFGNNTTTQMAIMTPTFAGDITSGYTATTTIGIAV